MYSMSNVFKGYSSHYFKTNYSLFAIVKQRVSKYIWVFTIRFSYGSTENTSSRLLPVLFNRSYADGARRMLFPGVFREIICGYDARWLLIRPSRICDGIEMNCKQIRSFYTDSRPHVRDIYMCIEIYVLGKKRVLTRKLKIQPVAFKQQIKKSHHDDPWSVVMCNNTKKKKTCTHALIREFMYTAVLCGSDFVCSVHIKIYTYMFDDILNSII